jgi:hypothetical protein
MDKEKCEELAIKMNKEEEEDDFDSICLDYEGYLFSYHVMDKTMIKS